MEIEVGAESSVESSVEIEAEINPQCVLSVVPYLERRLLPLRLWREGETVSEDSEAAYTQNVVKCGKDGKV